jgi:hypothetical protein
MKKAKPCYCCQDLLSTSTEHLPRCFGILLQHEMVWHLETKKKPKEDITLVKISSSEAFWKFEHNESILIKRLVTCLLMGDVYLCLFPFCQIKYQIQN